MSEYELQIQKNIDERKKMFEMLKLGSFKEDLGELFSQSIKRKTDANEYVNKVENFNLHKSKFFPI